jgi:hyaluronan synthase
VWATAGLLLLSFRTLLWLRYRPAESTTFADAPALTVIIPAYNEGPMVARSIDSVATAHYPRERLQIVVVDDGSVDDTWEHVSRAASRDPALITTIRFAQNRGKRAALRAGFLRARGEIVVTIDSDSVIDRAALLAMAGPFRDPRVGAVAGRVAVYNARAGLLPRMLDVRFALSFDLLRAVQSVYGTVYCCPGALAAYRLSVVREVLEAWASQTFLGAPCTYGEDRALTNCILDRGFDTVYQGSAVVRTIVPATYAKLVRMYLRWERSYVREELRLARIVWKRPPLARVLPLVDCLLTNLRYPLGYLSWCHTLSRAGHEPHALVAVLAALGIVSVLGLLVYIRNSRSSDLLYGVLYAYFSALTLFWIFPYAALTVRSRSWLTR